MNWSSRESVHGGARCVAGSVGVRNSEGSDRAREAAEAAHAGEQAVVPWWYHAGVRGQLQQTDVFHRPQHQYLVHIILLSLTPFMPSAGWYVFCQKMQSKQPDEPGMHECMMLRVTV
jgi:hypothetical protein